MLTTARRIPPAPLLAAAAVLGLCQATAARAATLSILPNSAPAGASVDMCAVLSGGGNRIAGIQANLLVDGRCANVIRGARESADCSVGPAAAAAGKQLSTVIGGPLCNHSPNCVRLILVAFDNTEPMGDGMLFCCAVTIPDTAPPGDCLIQLTQVRGSTPAGQPLTDIGTRPGILSVSANPRGGGRDTFGGPAPPVAGSDAPVPGAAPPPPAPQGDAPGRATPPGATGPQAAAGTRPGVPATVAATPPVIAEAQAGKAQAGGAEAGEAPAGRGPDDASPEADSPAPATPRPDTPAVTPPSPAGATPVSGTPTPQAGTATPAVQTPAPAEAATAASTPTAPGLTPTPPPATATPALPAATATPAVRRGWFSGCQARR